jgi:MoaA/NifB/PqqE/SkfB family radical SAM enzyme
LRKELLAIVSDRTPFFVGRPRVVHIWRSAPCNAKCIMCDYGFKTGDALKALFHSAFTDEMLSAALPQIAELGGRGTMVSYMGGEPTTSKHLLEWVQTASRLGLDFRFTTNGYKITPQLAEQLVSAGLFNIGVSLESIDPAINEQMRPYPKGTELTVRAIDLLLSERRRQKARLSINVKTVISAINMHSFLEIAQRWGKEDGVMVTMQTFEGMDGMPQATKDLLFLKDLEKVEKFVQDVRRLKREGYNIHITEQGLEEFLKLFREDQEHKSTMHTKSLEMDPSAPMCNIATDNLWIHDGMVRLCPYHPPIGNLMKDQKTLKEIWESEMCRKVREQTRACRRLCNISCLRRTPLRHKVQTFLRIA